MFDVTARDNISIDRLETVIGEGLSDIKLYTLVGRFEGQQSNQDSWVEIGSRTKQTQIDWSWITFDFDPINVNAGQSQSFYFTSSNTFLVGNELKDPLIRDEKIKFRLPGRAFGPTGPFGTSYVGYSL